MHKLTLSSLTLSVGLLTGCSPSEVNGITVDHAVALQNEQKAVIIDVREDQEWREKHIPGAMHIPLQQIPNRLAELETYKNSPIIMQCRSGNRSAKAAAILKDAGFQQVSNMEGGILAWVKAGLKTE